MLDLRMELKKIEDKAALFNDYLFNYNKVSKFFQWDPGKDMNQCLDERRSGYQHRETVVQPLIEQNKRWNASQKSLDNIEKLADKNTLAIVTGQQAGIFGGPLYTVYKIIHCLKLARNLKKIYTDYDFVPVFWMEVGDSDYQEINNVNYLSIQNELVRLSLPETEGDKRSIYLRNIPDDIDELLKNLESIFPQNEFRDKLTEDLKHIYSPGKSFSNAFAEWLHHLFNDFGLIIIDPTDSEFAQLGRPLFRRAIEKNQNIQKSIQENSEQIKRTGYTPQVILSPQQTLLFYRLEDGNRARLDFEGHKFIAHSSNSQAPFSKDFLLAEIEKDPTKFTPNVLFRPLVQDWLLPTAAYIGGPGEISYAAQLKNLYDIFGIVAPYFVPRMRLTLIEEKIQKTIDKLEIDPEALFFPPEKMIENQVDKNTDPRIKKLVTEIQENFSGKMDQLGKILIEADPTLESSIKKTSQNILDSLQRLENKATSAYERRIQTEINQIKKVQMNLQPNKILQERVFNIYQYLFKYGPELIASLYEVVNSETLDHQIVYF
jgi:bacillithiol biosynthesis cysteine-adding enzyme BshC